MKTKTDRRTAIYKIRLRDDANRAEFEQLMENEVLDTAGPTRNGASFDDELYVLKTGRGTNSYLWVISREPSQFGGPNEHVDIAAIFKSLKEKVEAFGEVTEFGS